MKLRYFFATVLVVMMLGLTGCTESSNPVGVLRTTDDTTIAVQKNAMGTDPSLSLSGSLFFVLSDVVGEKRISGEGSVSVRVVSVNDDPAKTAGGELIYKTSTGIWYQVAIEQILVNEDGTIMMGGPLTASNPAFFVPLWFYVSFHDGSNQEVKSEALSLTTQDTFAFQISSPPSGSDKIFPKEGYRPLSIIGGDIKVTNAFADLVSALGENR